MRPDVSVIIPVYNKKPFVARAIRSVLAQTHGNFELLVVDDGSTDGSAGEAGAFLADARVRVIQQANAGEGAARNRGWREARAGLCAFLDADDEFLPPHLERLIALAQRCPEAGLLGAAYLNRLPDGREVLRSVAGVEAGLFRDYFRTARDCGFPPVNASSVAARREILATVGGFREGLPVGADLEFWARAALRLAVAYDPRPSSIYYLLTTGSAMASYQWTPAVPAAVETIEREGAANQSAVDYAAWLLLKHAGAGVMAGKRADARSLLAHRIIADSTLRGRGRLVWAGSVTPAAALHFYLRFRDWQSNRASARSAAERRRELVEAQTAG